MVSVWMKWTALTVAVTEASLERYARLTLMSVLEFIALEMVGVWMALTISVVTVVQATQEHSVKLTLMIVLELTVVGRKWRMLGWSEFLHL